MLCPYSIKIGFWSYVVYLLLPDIATYKIAIGTQQRPGSYLKNAMTDKNTSDLVVIKCLQCVQYDKHGMENTMTKNKSKFVYMCDIFK